MAGLEVAIGHQVRGSVANQYIAGCDADDARVGIGSTAENDRGDGVQNQRFVHRVCSGVKTVCRVS
jgi:hypothetical protein